MPELIPIEAQVKEQKATQSVGEHESKSTSQLVTRLMQQAQRASRHLRSEWPENYRFVVSGEQWSIRRPKWRFSEVINLTWANIMTEVGIQTDSRPKVDYVATEPSDFQFADVLKEINDMNWSKPLITGHGWQRKLQTAIFKSKIYHVVHMMVDWDPEMEDGIGDVSLKVLDPYGCFWDPKADSIGEARWFIYAEAMPTALLKEKYPKQADQIKPDVTLFSEPSNDGIDDTDIDRFFTAGRFSDRKTTQRADRETDRFGGEPMTMWVRCWLKDETVIDEVKDLDDGTKDFIKKKKFPKGRYIEVANNVTLKDEENQFEDGLFPICTLVNYDYGEYAGENEVTHQRGPQKLVNYTLSHIMDQFKMGANPQKIVTTRAQSIIKKLTNEPGLVVAVPEQGDIRFEAGPGISPGSFNLLDSVKSMLDNVSGLFDVSKGAPQPGITSGLMLEGFVEAAQTRPRMKNRSVDEFLTQIGYLCASRYLQFYSAPRVFRLTNREGFPEFVTFFVTEDEEGNRVAKVDRQAQQPDGSFTPAGNIQTMSAKGIPDVKPVSGSNLPFARAQKQATALDLFSKGLITREAVLEAVNWPNAKEEAENSLKEAQALAQGAEQPQ